MEQLFSDQSKTGVWQSAIRYPEQRILIVEDDLLTQVMIELYLSFAGYPCFSVAHGTAACRALKDGCFSFVLLNERMPHMDGPETAETIRKMEQGEHEWSVGHEGRIPMMGLVEGDPERCLNSGMDGFCPKPVNEERLIRLVHRHLRNEMKYLSNVVQ